jgi:hypothetical protein
MAEREKDKGAAMSQIQWNSSTGGFFNSLLNWLGGVVPGATDTAVLGAGSAPYTVICQAGVLGLPLGGTQAVGAIQTAANATLEVLGGIDVLNVLGGTTTFSAANGAGGGANLGAVEVQNALYTVPILGTMLGGSANFEIGGVFDNVGSIALDGLAPVSGLSNADQMTMLTADGATTLTGGGVIKLSNDVLNLITGTAGAVLTNVNNVISGAGSITGVQLVNKLAGAIDADQALPLIIDAFGTTVNQGLLEATKGGALVLNGNIDNAGGTILADAGRVILGGVTITNGALVAGLSGSFVVLQAANAVLDGGLNGVNINGPLTLYSTASMTVEGALNNFGELLIKAGKGQTNTQLLVGAPGVILSGAGKILLNALSSVITSAAGQATLTNLDNLIRGSGLLGKGLLTLINGVNGTIAGAGPAGLVIDTGLTAIENAGVITAVKDGQTLIKSIIDNTGALESQGGTLTALNAVTGPGQGIVRGGMLVFGLSFAQNVIFQGAGVLQLAQSQSYTGTISGFSKTGATSLDLRDIGFVNPGEATYSGTGSGGVLTVTDGAHTAQVAMTGDYLGTTFVAESDGHGGADIIDQATPGAKVHGFIAAAAALEDKPSAGASLTHDHQPARMSMLAKPAAMAA